MPNVYYIPNGPVNLEPQFTVNFDDVEQYFIELLDVDNNIIATTTINEIIRCNDDNARVHFVNYLGCIDAIDFKIQTQKHSPKSDKYQAPTSYPLAKPKHSNNRFGVVANDTITASTFNYGEAEKEWLDELFDSPLAWLEKDLGQGQGKQFIPIVIVDTERNKIEKDNRYSYEITIEFYMSHDKFIIRN